MRSLGFVRSDALDWRVAAREEAWEAAAEAEAAAARRSGSGMRERVVGEGRSWGSPVGSGAGPEGMVSFLPFGFSFVGSPSSCFRGDVRFL